MPVLAACLVPSAPALLPWLTGDRVPELDDVRAAVRGSLDVLDGCDRLVLLAQHRPGTLAGFGSTLPAPVPSRARGSWPHELAHALLDSRPDHEPAPDWLPGREEVAWARVAGQEGAWLAQQHAREEATGLLLLADGSRTRGPRAPGGDDPRGGTVDDALAAALRDGTELEPTVRDLAPEVGADAVAAVDLLVRLPGLPAPAGSPGAGHRPVRLRLAAAPLGVGYLVATWQSR